MSKNHDAYGYPVGSQYPPPQVSYPPGPNQQQLPQHHFYAPGVAQYPPPNADYQSPQYPQAAQSTAPHFGTSKQSQVSVYGGELGGGGGGGPSGSAAPIVTPPRYPPPTGRQDNWATILFSILAAVFVGATGFFSTSLPIVFKKNSTPQAPTNDDIKIFFTKEHWITLGISLASIPVITYLIMLFIRKKPLAFIYAVFIALFSVLALFAIIFGLTNPIAAIPYVFLLLIFALSYFVIRKRIPFTACLFEYVVTVTDKYQGTYVASYCLIFVNLFFGLVFGAFVLGITGYAIENKDNNNSLSIAKGLGAYGLFFFFWFEAVTGYTLFVTVSGVISSVYNGAANANNTIDNGGSSQTVASFKRAMTTSFGSICYGSLIIAVIRFMKHIADSTNNRDSGIAVFLACIVQCILACLEDIVEFVNSYAFVYVALYGVPYCTAARDVWGLLKDRGFEVIINNNISKTCLGFAGVFGIILSTTLCVVLLNVFGLFGSTMNIANFIIVIVVILISSVVLNSSLSVFSTGAATLFVCIAENPGILYHNNPEFWNKIRETYPDAAFVGANY